MRPIERVRRQHAKIMHHKTWCGFGPLIAMGRTEVKDDIPTACTDGVNKFYGSEFISRLTDEELRFVILHEATHVAYLHLNVWKHLFDENRKLANVAADLFVNLALMDTDAGEGFIKMPSIGIPPDDKYRGWSVGKIYEDLKQNPPSGDGGQGFDEHDTSGDEDAAAQEKLAEEVGRLVRQGELIRKQRSKSGAGNDTTALSDLLNPKLDWRQVLRDFVQEQCSGRDESTWRKVNRRYIATDTYMPGMQAVTMGELVVGIDTSGSCFTTQVLTRFASELAGITEQVRPEKVRVLYWDTAVAGDQVFEDGQFAVSALKPTGGGGTTASCVPDYMRANRIVPQAVVMLTDGEVGDSWGKWDVPVLWVMTGKAHAPVGVTVRLGD